MRTRQMDFKFQKLKTLKPIMSADNSASTNGNAEDNTEEGVILDCRNALVAIMQPHYVHSKEFMLINGNDYWHKITVFGAGRVDKDAVLSKIMDFVYPSHMTPVMQRTDGGNLVFLVRRCGQAIEKLCRAKLTVDQWGIQIHLGFEHFSEIDISIINYVNKVIRKRYNQARKHLDLSNFHRDPELVETIYCPLSQIKMLTFVLNCVVNCQFVVRSLDMSKNGISFVRNLGNQWQLKHLDRLDLRYNSITSVGELVHFRQCQLQEILLDQNPICETYISEHKYMEDIHNALPTIVKVDGVRVPILGFPLFMKNFILSRDNIPLADQFIRQYFTLYDSENRRKLIGLYHEMAVFSLTATYLPAQLTSNAEKLTEYMTENRNLFKLIDYSKILSLLHQGPESILETLSKLPRTEHDSYSFTVDAVPCISGVMISVRGIFRESAMYKNPVIRSFCRVFVLVEVGPKTYQIANETLHITNATTKECEKAFQITKPNITQMMLASRAGNLNESEKDKMAETMSNLTTMNTIWSTKCLHETKWDIKEALVMFTELYKLNKIPHEAFIQ